MDSAATRICGESRIKNHNACPRCCVYPQLRVITPSIHLNFTSFNLAKNKGQWGLLHLLIVSRRDKARKLVGVSSKQRREDKDTWLWVEEVQESIRKKRLAKKRWDMQWDEKSKQEYNQVRRKAKKEVAKVKSKAYDEIYEGLDTKEGETTLYRLVRQRHQARKDV